ncbi:hypothetical protein SDC9_124708 [bioreactor metagenome]|uniref:Uncharacterized protein n=1 Tax=bioreactor metagenome TaxID=1076179 RepID=A0A645CL30_9ZZZZ
MTCPVSDATIFNLGILVTVLITVLNLSLISLDLPEGYSSLNGGVFAPPWLYTDPAGMPTGLEKLLPLVQD